MAAIDDYVLETPANEWSLSGFLEHRANKKDFTGQKDKEHFRYQRCLFAVQSSDEFNTAEKEQAEHCLEIFPDEVANENLNLFWRLIALEKNKAKLMAFEKEKELLIERTMLQHVRTISFMSVNVRVLSLLYFSNLLHFTGRDEDAEIPVNAIERNRDSIGFDADNAVKRRERLEDQEQFDIVECDMELGTSLTSKESTPSWIHEACGAVEEIRKLSDGVESPMWWRILDLRPETDRAGAANKRAKEYFKPDTLKRLVPPRLLLRQSIMDERTIMVLNILQSMSSSKLIAQFREFPVIGTYGILQDVLSTQNKMQEKCDDLEELLEKRVNDGTPVDNTDKSDAEIERPLSLAGEKLEEMARHEDIIGLSQCVYETIQYLESNIQLTSVGERTMDMAVFRSLFNILKERDLIQVHYEEAESRASRTRRERISRNLLPLAKPCGDHFDWLCTSFSVRPDGVRGLEIGVAENVGPRNPQDGHKAVNDSVKVFKASRDLWEEIRRIVREEAGGALTEIMVEGLRAIPIVGITLMGMTIRVHMVYNVGGNMFALSEFCCSRMPSTLDALPTVIESIRLFVQTKKIMKNATSLIQALIKRAKEVRSQDLNDSVADNFPSIEDLGTPSKLKQLKRGGKNSRTPSLA